MKTSTKSLFISFALVFIVSCNSQETNSSIISETTQTIAPRTDNHQPTLQPAVSPTATTSPSPAESNSQEQLLISEDLPIWMSDETISKFIIQFGDIIDFYKYLGVVNAETGEMYDPKVDNILGYFWLPESQYLGLVLDTKNDILLVNHQTGERLLVKISDKALDYTHFGFSTPRSLITNKYPIEHPEFRLFDSFSKISDNGKYLIDTDNNSTSVIDLGSGETITVTNPDEGIYDLGRAWVPNTDQLSIIQSDYPPGPGYFFEIGIEPNIRLNIYNIHKEEVINTIPGIPQANWSPDGQYLLFQPMYEAGKSLLESAPCLLNTATDQTNCLNELELPVGDVLPDPVRYHSLSWSPSGKMFSFAYYSAQASGLCLVEVDNLSVRYMLADLFAAGYHVAATSWSPDEKYIDFQYGKYYPFSDADLPPFHGVLDIRSGDYIEIGETISGGSWEPKSK